MVRKMLRCIFALLLINIYYPTAGLPLKGNGTQIPIAQQLDNLANICDNQVLTDLIKNQIDHCNLTEPANAKTEFHCAMFYDINSQLCTAFRRSKFNLKENYTTKMNEIKDIKTICDHAMTWKFTLKDNYPKNEPVENVFKDDVLCIQMCSGNEFLSADSNYFCKYYQWGSEILQNHIQALAQQNIAAPVPVIAQSILNPIENKILLPSLKTDNNTSTSKSAAKTIETKAAADVESTKTETSKANLSVQTSMTNQSSMPDTAQKPLDNSQKITEQSASPNVTSASKNEIVKPIIDDEPPRKDEVESEFNIRPLKDKEYVIVDKVIRPVMDIEDDQEEEVDEEAEYVQNSEQEDAAMKPDLKESDPTFDDNKPKNALSTMVNAAGKTVKVPYIDANPNMDEPPHKARAGIESITSVSETFPNPMQNGYADEDDHFFPLFLTCIIIAILMYILYHNKNKFTKVVMGLLIEGRQTGRRRNSRGHAYRRLDTLEQAMNTNTAAPPSKIIY